MLLSRVALFAYGLFGLPLALVALPIYVYVPQFYAEQFGMSLAAIGTALLAARMFDAFIDPALGLWIDRRKAARGYGYFILLALPALAAGFVALFHPPAAARAQPFAWFLACLLLVYVGFSLATIAYQSWGAALTQARSERSRLTGTREACGLVGVLVAAALPSVAGIGTLSTVFVVTLLGSAALLLMRAPRPAMAAASAASGGLHALQALSEPFRDQRFRWLFAVFVVNGIAAAIPATLFLFFAKDRLQLGQYAGLFLVLYFAAAAVSLPLWGRAGAAARRGLDLDGGDAAGDRRLRLGVCAAGRGRDRLRHHLRDVGLRAWRRPGTAACVAGRGDRPRRSWRHPRRRVLRRLELGHQDESGAGRRCRPAAAAAPGLRTRHSGCGWHASAAHRLCTAAVRPQAAGSRATVARAAE